MWNPEPHHVWRLILVFVIIEIVAIAAIAWWLATTVLPFQW